MVLHETQEESVQAAILELVSLYGSEAESFEREITAQMIENCLKFLRDKHTTAQMKLILRAMKEMRYAYRIFNQYPSLQRISIFGSARTPEDHPDYKLAKQFSKEISDLGWMCITGAANGIMKAGHEGARKESRFGLAIRLAFETSANTIIEGDPKLINFKYFFTRKLMFLGHSDAVAVFPGGVGTQDELFEVLTLMQTGKSNIIPLVLLEGKGGKYWKKWEEYFEENLRASGWVSPEDTSLYYKAKGVKDAVRYIQHFYKIFHSYRYVKDHMVIRLKSPLKTKDLEKLNEKYSSLLKSGKIEQRKAFSEEKDYLDLPRLSFVHTKRDFSLLKLLIDDINRF